MKYIRTKDGHICEIRSKQKRLNGEYDTWYVGNNVSLLYNHSHHLIDKEADAIEELCDEFVFEDSDGHFLCNLCEQTDIDVGSKFDELVYWFNHSKEEQYKIRNCYGAIWTDKGLIYKAKMKGVLPNGEIDWELL